MTKIIIFHEIWLGMVPRTSGIHSRFPPISKIKPNMVKNYEFSIFEKKCTKKNSFSHFKIFENLFFSKFSKIGPQTASEAQILQSSSIFPISNAMEQV